MDQEQKDLLLFQLGPVQEFIAQAEKIGDLRVGSELLSELTAAALEVIPDYETESVFPAVKKRELKGIPNRFLVYVPHGKGEELAKCASEAAQKKLTAIAEECWKKLTHVPGTRYNDYLAQVKAFLQTTWAVLKNPSGNMGADYKTIGKLMAMRRNTRQFEAWHEENPAAIKDFLSGKESALDVADNRAPNKNSGRGAMNLIKTARTTQNDLDVATGLGKYIAVIAMDGDHMGGKLSSFATQDQHRRFSEKLADFARQVEINSEDGILIYAGGDDVLAVVKATRAIAVARELARKFKGTVNEHGVTASAGIAIGSCKAPLQDLIHEARAAETIYRYFEAKETTESLQDLIHEARAAESRAKHVYERNALAVSVLKRSGEILKWGCKWDSAAFDIYNRLTEQSGKLSRFAYKLAGFLEPYALKKGDLDESNDMRKVVLEETLHTLKQTEGAGEVLTKGCLEAYLKEQSVKDHPEDFLGLFMCEAFINRPRD